MSTDIFAGTPQIMKEFAMYKKTVQNCSEKTVSEYISDIKIFSKFILMKKDGITPSRENMEECDISALDYNFYKDITGSDIYEFLYYLDTVRSDISSTRARKLSAIKAFYKYMTAKKGYFTENPCTNIESPKKAKTLPKFLSVEESIRLLDAINSDTESKTRVRDYAMVTLFLNCGMRLSELAGIDMKDISRDFRSVRITGKGNKQRNVYFNDACKSALGDYYTQRLATETDRYETALFISSRGKRISVKTIQYVVYKYLDLAGLGNKGYSTHKLRHTAATLMYQTGQVDIRVLKDILGHEQLNTTQIYTHVSDKGMQDAMEKNPLSSVNLAKKKTDHDDDEK